MVIDADSLRLLQTGNLDRCHVGYIVDDVYIKSPDRIYDFSLLLSIGESGVFHVDSEIRAMEGGGKLSCGNLLGIQVVEKGYGLQQLLLGNSMTLGQGIRYLLIAVYVEASKMLNDFACKIL